ncbi:hypothetical protein BDR26DRAFT_853447 [Obelidium mucronatum]|nr:hypothetical protein BDR26DRAFT_853447 [Obelidium mucronatum]
MAATPVEKTACCILATAALILLLLGSKVAALYLPYTTLSAIAADDANFLVFPRGPAEIAISQPVVPTASSKTQTVAIVTIISISSVSEPGINTIYPTSGLSDGSKAATQPSNATFNQTMNDILTAVVSTLNPCALQCLGLPPSTNITVSQWTQICDIFNNTLSSNSTSDSYANSVKALGFNSSADVGNVIAAGVGLLESTKTLGPAADLAAAQANAICGSASSLNCGSLVTSGVQALQAVCSTMSPEGLNVTASSVVSLLGAIAPSLIPVLLPKPVVVVPAPAIPTGVAPEPAYSKATGNTSCFISVLVFLTIALLP